MSASVVVALFGGVGAAVGASLGQLVQWWREHVRTGIEERRRAEDRADALAREQRDRDERIARERREARRHAYQSMTLSLDRLEITLSDALLQFEANAPQVPLGDGNKRALQAAWSSVSAGVVDAADECVPLILGNGSDDMIKLRPYLRTIRGLVEHVNFELDLRADGPKVIPHLVTNAGTLIVRTRLHAWTVSEAATAHHGSLAVMAEIIDWALAQIRFELGNTGWDTPPGPPFTGLLETGI